ncbi:MAG: hypothetical protein LBJ00_12715 [Planctomycetaceae bacterium]|nr:hypothetical protein [Planctomycetaceae bacterium]
MLWLFRIVKVCGVYSSDFKIPAFEQATVASRSDCSRAKPTVHIGFGILTENRPNLT